MNVTSPPFETFTVRHFMLESGQMLPEASIAYQISGEPNALPPIITCTAFSQNHDDLEYLRRPGMALYPEKNWIIHTEMLGNGRSTSPSNSREPRGSNFPQLSIRDNVRLQAMLLDFLEVGRIRAVVGASMGGQQALQWAVSYPERMDQVVAIVGSARATLHAQLFLHSLAQAIRSDPAFNNGRYTTPPQLGLSRMAEVWAAWATSPMFFSRGHHLKYEDTSGNTLHEFLAKWRSRYDQKDANDLLSHLDMWSRHDIGQTAGFGGSTRQALKSIKARVLFLPCRTDAYFAAEDVQAEAAHVPHSRCEIIDSVSGHAAGFGRDKADQAQVSEAISRFFSAE